MHYVVGYSQRAKGFASEAQFSNARETLEGVEGLERSDEIIRYIRAPWGGEIGKTDLKTLVERELRDPYSST